MEALATINRLSDEELAAKAQTGSSRFFFEELVRRYNLRLFRYLRPRLSSDEDTEDIVQEAFLKTYRNIHRFDDTYKFSTWLYTTATRLVISLYRKHRDNEARGVEIESMPGPEDPHNILFRQEDARNLWLTAKKMKPAQYEALWLRYVENMSLKEIAGIMNKSQVSVRVLLHRARSQLVKFLAPADTANESFAQKAAGTDLPIPEHKC